jgi:hypothetical protein
VSKRQYTKKQAMLKLGLSVNNNSQLMDIIRRNNISVEYIVDPERHNTHLMIDADAIDAVQINHRTQDGTHEYSVRIDPDVLEVFFKNANKFAPKDEATTKALAAVIKALKEGEDLTEKRRKYNLSRKAEVAEAILHKEG